MLTLGAITLIINVATSVLKRYVYPKYGKFGVQLFAFACALIAAVYVTYKEQFPGVEEFVVTVLAIFSMAVAFYEVVLQNISWFKVNTPEIEKARALEKKLSKM